MRTKGDSWNESQTYKDAVTGRTIRRVTTVGDINEKAPYHTRTTFTEDGEFLVFSTFRDGASTVCRARVESGEITQLIDPVPARDKCLSASAIAPRTGWLFFWQEISGQSEPDRKAGKSRYSLRSVNVHTLEERTVVADLGPNRSHGLISVDPDETEIVFPVRITSGHKDERKTGEGMIAQLAQVPLSGGTPEVFYEDERLILTHLEHCPTDGDLLYIDRDLPPLWHSGGDYSKTSRCWMLRRSTGELTALTPRAEAKFQIHGAWSWNGELLLYHGPAVLVKGPCPWYVGAVYPNGEIYREWVFEKGVHYGHVAAAPNRHAVILDGNVTPNQLVWLYLDGDEPRIETICEHNTELNSLPGQVTHAHPSTDKPGRWIAYNVAKDGRTDVHVVEV